MSGGTIKPKTVKEILGGHCRLHFSNALLGPWITSKYTLGYEILNEPQVHTSKHWAKVGKYNTFITNTLRQITNKTLVYSMNIPVQPNGSPKDVAMMTPKDKDNLVFKFTIYDAPRPGSFEGNKSQQC